MAKKYDPILCMMVDEPAKAQDESYIVRGKKYKVVKRDGDNVTVIGPDGKVTKMHIDFLMSEGKKVSDSASALDEAIKTADESTYKVEYSDIPGSKKNYAYVKANSENEAANKVKGVVYSVKIVDSKTIDEAIKVCDAASGDAMKQIASTAKSWTKQYNQLFEKATTEEEVNKIKSQSDNDYRRALDNLDKIYNEVSQAYDYARNEVRSLFDEVGSKAFKAYRRVTQK